LRKSTNVASAEAQLSQAKKARTSCYAALAATIGGIAAAAAFKNCYAASAATLGGIA